MALSDWQVFVEQGPLPQPTGEEAYIVVCVSNQRKERREAIFPNSPSEDQFKAKLREIIAKIESRDVAAVKFKPDLNTPIDLTLPTPPTPSPVPSPEQSAFLAAYRIAQSAQRLVDAGVLATDHADVVQARNDAAKAYQSAFVGLG